MIEINHLFVAFGDHMVLEDIKFSVQDGEFIALIGPNGSGKTTLLRAMARIIPYRGEISMDGANIQSLKRKNYAKRLAMVNQFNDAALEMSVMDMVLMGRSPYKQFFEGDGHRDVQQAEKSLEMVGLSHLKERPLKALSGGERQRAVLARAFVQETDHILLDEATNHLDIYYQLSILDLLRQSKKTTVAALHDMNLALAYADRIVALKEGKCLFNKKVNAIEEKDIFNLYGVNCRILQLEEGMRVVFNLVGRENISSS